MGEGLFTCICGEATSDYRGEQCPECGELFCSDICAYDNCCATEKERKAKAKKGDKLKQKREKDKKTNCKCVKCEYCINNKL